mgnify:CR=1 FL=1
MSYTRVLPRDLFNEANLLKCVGKLTMMIEDGLIPWLTYAYDGEAFDIRQDGSDGSLRVHNIEFYFRDRYFIPRRPLNSRDSWPLYAVADGAELEIFDDFGNLVLTEEKLARAYG